MATREYTPGVITRKETADAHNRMVNSSDRNNGTVFFLDLRLRKCRAPTAEICLGDNFSYITAADCRAISDLLLDAAKELDALKES
jgi:hypothetical protein